MFKLKRHLVPFSVIISLLATLCFVFAQESLTITTYYPSPYGSYQDLETGNLTFRNSTDALVHFNYPGASPTYDRRLRITAGEDDITGNTQGASIDLHGVNATTYLGRLDLFAGQGGNLTFWSSPVGTSATERMRITDAGNVGIGTGTTGPLVKMDVRGTNARTATVALENIIQAASTEATVNLKLRMGIKTDATATNRYGAIEVDDDGTRRSLVLQPTTGNVGIGLATTAPTAPQHKLDVVGSLYSRLFTLTTTTGAIAVNWDNGNTQKVTLTGPAQFTLSNGQAGAKYILIITYTGAGQTVNFTTAVKWPGGSPPGLTPWSVSTTDFIGFIYDGSYCGVATVLDVR